MTASVIEELLIKIGIDASDAKKIDNVINQLTRSANKVGSTVDSINANINKSSVIAKNALHDVSNESKKTQTSLSILKLSILGLIAGAALYGRRLAGSFNSAIDNAKTLFYRKNALFRISRQELIQARQYQLAMSKTKLAIESVATKIALNLTPNLISVIND